MSERTLRQRKKGYIRTEKQLGEIREEQESQKEKRRKHKPSPK